jgi:outer membrane lipoprotein-sorting protein
LLLTAGSAPAAEPSLQDVVRRVEQHYNQVRTLEAEFLQRYSLGASNLVETGRVYFQKPGRMRWEYLNPEPKLFLADGDWAYLYVPGERQVRRQALQKTADWQAAFALVLGRVELRRLFGPMALHRVDRPEDPTRWQLRGRARSGRQAFREVWLDLNQKFQVLRIEVRQRDDSILEFHFRGWRENGALPSGLFELQVPPGTAWIDSEAN